MQTPPNSIITANNLSPEIWPEPRKRSMWFNEKKKEKKKKNCVNQPVRGKKAIEEVNLERGDPVAKMERELPDLAFWMTRGGTDKMASNLRCHQTTEVTS